MKEPLLSIIIPVYNIETYISECLDSILSQDMTCCEVIAVDDDSTDCSLDILRTYEQRYPNTIRVFTQTNGRQSKARNHGVAEMKGKYIYFVDGDDYLLPNAIDTILQIVRRKEDVDVFQLDAIWNSTGGRMFVFPNKDFLPMQFVDYYLTYFAKKSITCGPMTYIYSKKFWDENNLSYKEHIKYEDRLFLYNLVTKKGLIQLIHLTHPIYYYRIQRVGSTTTHFSLDNFIDRQYIWREAYKLFKSSGMESSIYYHEIFSYIIHVLTESCGAGYINQYSSFFSSEDLTLMKKGIWSLLDRKYWLLIKYDPVLFAMYRTNTCSKIKRRLINQAFTIFDILFPNWLLQRERS